MLLLILTVNAYAFFGENPEPQIDFLSIENNKNIEISLQVSFDEGFYLSANKEFVNFSLIGDEDFKLVKVEYPKANAKNQEYYSGLTVFKLILKQRDVSKIGEFSQGIKMNYQFCDEAGTCFFPDSEEVEISFTLEQAKQTEKTKTSSLLLILLLAFIGGISLNIMPCVLPILSIKALSLVNQAEGSKKEIIYNSLLYSLGILVSFLVLATIVAVLKLVGTSVGWGFQLQSVGFNLFLLILIFVFALSLFDVFVLSVRMGSGISKTKSVYLGSFLSGIIAVLLGTSCTAPVLAPVLGFAFSQSIAYVFLIFILIGVGFSLPFLLLGFFPKLIQKLPKPGNWMNTFKEFMGFLLLFTSLIMLNTVSNMMGLAYTLKVVLFLTILALILWVFGKVQKKGYKKRPRLALYGILLISAIVAGYVILEQAKEPAQVESNKYEAYNRMEFDSEIVRAEVEAGKRVFLAFGASWCSSCRTNERRVLNRTEIVDFFKEHDIAVYYGDFTQGNEEILAWIKEYNRAGVPFYIYYDGEKVELLPENLSVQRIYNLVE